MIRIMLKIKANITYSPMGHAQYGWEKVALQCEYTKHSVYSCIIIYYYIIFHKNNHKPTFPNPYM